MGNLSSINKSPTKGPTWVQRNYSIDGAQVSSSKCLSKLHIIWVWTSQPPSPVGSDWHGSLYYTLGAGHETESLWPSHFKHSHWWKRAEPVQVRYFTLRSRGRWSRCVEDDGCKVDMDSYMVSNGSRFMVTWTVFKHHFLGVGSTQNWETVALRTFATVGLFYFNPLRARSHMASHYAWGSVTTLHDSDGALGRPFGHFLLGSHNLMVTARV